MFVSACGQRVGLIVLKVILSVVSAALILAGCAAVESVPLGTARDEVVKQYGTPTRTVTLATGTRLQYSRQPLGRSAVMVGLDAAGRVTSVRQVLNSTDFSRVVVGQWTRDDVEREFGKPAFVSHVGSWKGDIMTYRWRDAGSDMLFWIYLDPGQVAQRVGQTEEFKGNDRDNDRGGGSGNDRGSDRER